MAEVDSIPENNAVADEAHQPNDSALVVAGGASELVAPAEKKVKKIIRRKKRPARVQMDPALIKDMAPPQTGTSASTPENFFLALWMILPFAQY